MTKETDDDWPPQPDDIALEPAGTTPELLQELKSKSEHPEHLADGAAEPGPE
jgi:hypothetical protein